MILSLYLSLTGLLRNHEKMVGDCDLILLSGQLKLSRRTMEAQPWWESSAWACSRLQSWELSTCSTSSPGWRGSKTGWSRSSSCLSSSSATSTSCKRFHQRGEELLEGHLEESLCHVVKKVPFEVNFSSKLPPGVKSRALFRLEVLPDQQRHFEGNGGHGGDLPHHPDPVQVRHTGHAFIDILSRNNYLWDNIPGFLQQTTNFHR